MMTTLARCWVTQDVRRLPWPSPVHASMTARALYCALCLLDLGTCSGRMYPALRCTLMVSSGASSVNHCPLLWTADLGDDGGGDGGDGGGDGRLPRTSTGTWKKGSHQKGPGQHPSYHTGSWILVLLSPKAMCGGPKIPVETNWL